ncbi:GntR family transcriptional regulator [Streptomyces albus]|uniref:GntR family transcriptional regulator n=1 Tax=Streptomyces sp. NRRL F-5917 TaxID=1463873 RepID=UPI0004BF61D6|nr:GntR family transcriptional regulator [Streptomyces sp. NRRL F-5917]
MTMHVERDQLAGLLALARSTFAASRHGDPHDPASWEETADRLHALASQLVEWSESSPDSGTRSSLTGPVIRALRARPCPAGQEHVLLLVNVLRPLVRALEDDGGPGGRISVSDWVAQRVRERIASGVYPDGALLPRYDDLAAEFGVSHASVCSGIKRLRAEWLVATRTGRRAQVTCPRRPPRRGQRAAAAPVPPERARSVRDAKLPLQPQSAPCPPPRPVPAWPASPKEGTPLKTLRVATFNFEMNGGADRRRWQAGHPISTS